ncbi:50S ribosomal protein L24 [Alkalibacterium putridalgicola]|jgi:large subunit ribosomal protein L24|uniref:Large ribosomal subunit protein uL24 n=1 Tax=Alkalibacterium putridalgicola TaxID=426703 RepID=A0A1H7VEZ4_9LACT|nr:50S ribosomal protein L24 [Alkalibacterium putridalgicola]GEK89792.1 50S ribosomal protein L24 [Alkalibacterium putridalgicola]SEM07803.1 large subunit ribosomal protein L24 [Alkalibacterium putridalgicola]
MFVKTGDKVKVIAGKDKGKEGTILAAMPKQNKVIVEGLNIMKKHTRPTGMGQEGGIVEKEAPIHVSNVQLIDPETNESTRVGYKVEDGKKVRYAKKSGGAL